MSIKSPAEVLSSKKKRRKRSARPPRKLIWKCEVHRHREALGLSMKEVATACGMTQSGFFCIEYGTDPQLTTARRIAEFFGKTIDELWPSKIGDHSR